MAHEARPGALPPTVLSARSGLRGAREVAEEAETVASGGNIAVATLQSQPQLGRVSLGGTAAIEVDGERYVREALLGIGGMGEVHLHTDRRIGRHVAMKTLLGGQAGETSVVRFIREARVQGQLEHPAVVPVYDLGTDVDGRPCFTMKRIHGHSLSRILADLARQRAEPRAQPSRYTLRKLLGAFVQVALAVE